MFFLTMFLHIFRYSIILALRRTQVQIKVDPGGWGGAK
jgi:hypothetical protein